MTLMQPEQIAGSIRAWMDAHQDTGDAVRCRLALQWLDDHGIRPLDGMRALCPQDAAGMLLDAWRVMVDAGMRRDAWPLNMAAGLLTEAEG